MSKYQKNWCKLLKIANIDKENIHIFWTTWGISMNFSEKMLYDNVKCHKKRTEFHPLFRKYIFGKNTGMDQIDHPF